MLRKRKMSYKLDNFSEINNVCSCQSILIFLFEQAVLALKKPKNI